MSPIEVVKSESDKRRYRVITLKNGLTALLVSEGSEHDDEEDTQSTIAESTTVDSSQSSFSAAALCVRAGSWMEPDSLPGLAHFLEHMLFMGSSKYPAENDFDTHIKNYGGQTNANTHAEWTEYFFDIQNVGFKGALDRFANFFIHPLMCKGSAEKEVKMIHAEWAMKSRIEKVRFEQLMGTMAKEGHPIGKFTWGNQESLQTTPANQGVDVCQALQCFWKENYLAQYMFLAIVSKESLDVLQSWVEELFEGILGSSKPLQTFEHLGAPFDTPLFKRVYKIIPSENICKMQLTWALPSLVEHYRKKPLNYLGMLLGHEGPGSIISLLRDRNLARAIESTVLEMPDEFNTACSCFYVAVTLTAEGMAHFETVITTVFQYLKLLSRQGFHRSFWDEAFNIEQIKFRYLEQIDPMKYVEQLAKDMIRYQPQDYIQGSLMLEYDEQLLRSCLDKLQPHTMNVALWSMGFRNEGVLTKEKWFQTEHLAQDISNDWVQTWMNCECIPELFLPESNAYIATDFTLEPSDCPIRFMETPLTDTEVSRLWYRKDEDFLVPKASINFFLKSCEADRTPYSACMLDLYTELLKDHITEVVYPAELAEISCQIVALDRGIVFRMSGFSHKLSHLFIAVIERVATFHIREELFGTVKQELHDFYENCTLSPEILNKQLRRSLLYNNHWDVLRKRECISTVSLESLRDFVANFYGQMFVEGLIQGNISSRQAKNLEAFLLDRLEITVADSPEYLKRNSMKRLPLGCSVYMMHNRSDDDENSVITNYYQYGECDLHGFLINEMILGKMEEPCFSCLRTAKQLGYHVQTGSTYLYGIAGFTVTICSLASKCTMQILDNSIEEFLQEFHRNHIETLTEEAFQEIVSTQLQQKHCDDANLQSEVDRHWREILLNSYLFDRQTKEISELETITLEELKSWGRNFISPESNRRKLSIQVVGNERQSNSRRTCSRRSSHGPRRHQSPSGFYTNLRLFQSVEAFKAQCNNF